MGLFEGNIPFSPRSPAPAVPDAQRTAVYIPGGAGVGYRIDSGGAGLITLDGLILAREYLELSPAVSSVYKVVSRIGKSIPLKLKRPNGGEYKQKHPVLKLWNDSPNPIQSAASFREGVFADLIYSGEAVLRVMREGMVPKMIWQWAADAVTIDSSGAQGFGIYGGGGEPEGVLLYSYGPVGPLKLDPDRPPVMHARLNVDPKLPSRGRPAVWSMPYEVIANVTGSRYRNEVFSQGGPPRLAIRQEPGAAGMDPTIKSADDAKKASKGFDEKVKSPASWRGTPVLPAGWVIEDLGPKGTSDWMMISAARFIDEKIAAAYGVPVLFLNNMERSTYTNARVQDRSLIRDAVRPLLTELEQCIRRDMLIPMGGVNETLIPEFDAESVMQDEPVIRNKIIIDRVKAGVITKEVAAEELGYDASAVPEPEPEPAADPAGTDGGNDGGSGEK